MILKETELSFGRSYNFKMHGDKEHIFLLMLNIYCKKNHNSKTLCDDCSSLLEYTQNKIKNCPYLPDKPACNKCKTRCFKSDAEMRIKIRKVMSFSGPKMILYHPLVTFKYAVEKYKKLSFRP